MARQRPKGEYTSDASRAAAEKILSRICCAYVMCYLSSFVNKQCVSYHVVYDSLVNLAREGSFVLEPQHDILIEAIGTKEHGGRVRGI